MSDLRGTLSGGQPRETSARPSFRNRRAAFVRAIVLAAACAIANAGMATAAWAHPIHTTLTKVTSDDHSITLNIRAFADDFSATVARFAGHKPPVDSSAPLADVVKYLRAQFAVLDGSGKAVQLEACGVQRAAELYWLCFRAVLPTGAKGARIRNQMLTELHSDQVNIVQLEGPGTHRTMLFTKGSAPALIGS
jgi:hypothetical protein